MLGCDSVVPTTKQTLGNAGRRLWVIHSEEGPEGPYSAERVAAYLANTDRRASINACVDRNSVVGQVDWDNTAWHCGHGSTNAVSCGVEHDGYARQTRAEWLDPDGGMATLQRSAALFRLVGMDRYGIQPVHLTGAALVDCVMRGKGSGYCGHGDVTRAFAVRGGHTDPGDGFPFDLWAAWAVGHAAPPAVVTPEEGEDMNARFVQIQGQGPVYLATTGGRASHARNEQAMKDAAYIVTSDGGQVLDPPAGAAVVETGGYKVWVMSADAFATRYGEPV